MKKAELTAYSGSFSEESLMDKIARFGKKMGGKLLFNVYVLYYVLMASHVPIKVKLEIIGALGYVITPLDLIPDWIPVAGFTDDLTAIAFAVETARAYITPDIQHKAEQKVYQVFRTTEACVLADKL